MERAMKHDEERTNAHGLPGTIREIRAAANDRGWDDLTIMGWAIHLPAGWTFIPASRRTCAMTPNFHATFISCLPPRLGGLHSIESREVKP
jgi:hypothetical protein